MLQPRSAVLLVLAPALLASCDPAPRTSATAGVGMRPSAPTEAHRQAAPTGPPGTAPAPEAAGIRLRPVPVDLGGDPLPDGEPPLAYTVMSGGVGLVDLDGDGDLDVLLTSEWSTLRAFRNDGGWALREATEELGLAGLRHVTALALGDCDGDRTLEIFLSRSGRAGILRLDPESGRWAELEGTGVEGERVVSLSAAFSDVDGDGDLDLLQCVYFSMGERAAPPLLFLNEGGCTFRKVEDSGLLPGMCVDLGPFDADADGDPDLLVANDFGLTTEPTRFFENRGGRFHAPEPPRGIRDELFGMGVAVGDLDRDGRLDAYVTNIGRNPWYRNRGTEGFVDASDAIGVGLTWQEDLAAEPASMPFYDPASTDEAERRRAAWVARYAAGRPHARAFATTTWSSLVSDLDADGWPDLLLTNGTIGSDLVPGARRQRLAVLRGGPGGFAEVTTGAELAGNFRGAALGDLDGDGRPDVVVFEHMFQQDAPLHRVLRNASTGGSHVRVQLEGWPPNTWGIGARVEVRAGGETWVQERSLRSGTYSASADAMFFGIGAAREADITVHWPWSTGVTEVRRVPAGTEITIRR